MTSGGPSRPLSAVRLIVFDLDGTLVDSSVDLTAAINATLRQIAPGTPPLSRDRVISYVGDGAAALVGRALEACGLSVPVSEVLPAYLQAYRDRLLDSTCLYAGVEETLGRLSERRLAVLTNKPGDMSRAILQGLGVAGRFAAVYGGGDVPERKPSPGGLLRLMREHGAAATETAMVGDSWTDVRTARAAGTLAVGVSYGFAPASLAGEPPDLMIDDLRELPALL
jgi:phosphoglycolate phosphatase